MVEEVLDDVANDRTYLEKLGSLTGQLNKPDGALLVMLIDRIRRSHVRVDRFIGFYQLEEILKKS